MNPSFVAHFPFAFALNFWLHFFVNMVGQDLFFMSTIDSDLNYFPGVSDSQQRQRRLLFQLDFYFLDRFAILRAMERNFLEDKLS